MKYTAKQLIERAMKLADIANTDFLTHKELLEYINDSWTTLFQLIIQNGDSIFVKEAVLTGVGVNTYTEYDIPFDCFQIKSVKNPISGEIIPRYTESESISSRTYDIVNDKIRLYGGSSPLLLTYWLNPLYITFPDKAKEVEFAGDLIDTVKNSALLSDGTIKNLVTGEMVAEGIPAEIEALGNGHYIKDGAYYNYNNSLMYEIPEEEQYTLFKDENGNVYRQTKAGEIYLRSNLVDAIDDYTVLAKNGDAYCCTNGIWYDGNFYEIDSEISEALAFKDWDNKPAFLVRIGNTVKVLVFHEEGGLIELNDLELSVPFYTALLEYGPLMNNGTDYTIISRYPDTEFNFPNNLYFSLMAADLAIRFTMKMNADNPGLQGLYADMKAQYSNSLSQSADYFTMKNVY